MWSDNQTPYTGSRPAEPEDSAGYADFIGDAVFFLLCVSIAVTVTYAVVITLRPDVWIEL